jgi:hypothetical protein
MCTIPCSLVLVLTEKKYAISCFVKFVYEEHAHQI